MIFYCLLAYLIGSIPTAVWVGKIFYKIDVREHGSGNAGATNVFRVLGKKAGIPVMLIDLLKGWFAVELVQLSHLYNPGTESYTGMQILMAFLAIAGHLFPVFAGFRGGKGIASLTGAMIAIHPQAAMISVLIFLVLLLITSYVSLSSMITSFVFPFLIILVYHSTLVSLNIFSFAVAILVFATHQKNIERLLTGEENKAKLFGAKK